MAQDPYLHIVGPNMAQEPYGIGINLENTGLVRFVNGTLERIRRDGTWNTLYRKWLTVLGPGAGAPDTEVSGLMDTPDTPEVDVGTQPASFDDLGMDSVSTMRPMATQAVFRPQLRRRRRRDSVGSVDTEPQDDAP